MTKTTRPLVIAGILGAGLLGCNDRSSNEPSIYESTKDSMKSAAETLDDKADDLSKKADEQAARARDEADKAAGKAGQAMDKAGGDIKDAAKATGGDLKEAAKASGTKIDETVEGAEQKMDSRAISSSRAPTAPRRTWTASWIRLVTTRSRLPRRPRRVPKPQRRS